MIRICQSLEDVIVQCCFEAILQVTRDNARPNENGGKEGQLNHLGREGQHHDKGKWDDCNGSLIGLVLRTY